MGTCGSVGDAKSGSRVMLRYVRKREWRIERMAAGVLGGSGEVRERGERREEGRWTNKT